ncbi:hypothetical protein AURDEDRAFT_121501 [Auricularia subglabra TFB-10046 SS5]|nr:hypothetical protein AURDEDRAFT_121501 [Auricularia subglabra TFB-10046 SS5]
MLRSGPSLLSLPIVLAPATTHHTNMALSIDMRKFLRRARQTTLQEKIAHLTGFSNILRDRLDEADAALEAAEEAVVLAEQRREQALADLLSIEEVRLARLEELANFPTIWDYELIRTLPEEILSMIFVEVVRSWAESSVDIIEEEYDFERAVAPFQLAAVCRRWRHVAVEAPALWNYIALPSRARRSSAKSLAAQIDLLLKRSKQQLLTVFFHCDSNTVATWMWPLLVPVRAAFSRWQRAVLVLPTNVHTLDLVFLTPVSQSSLSTFYLDWIGPSRYPEDLTNPPLLSGSDAMRSLNLYALFIRPQSVFNFLLSATLFVDHVEPDHVADALRGMPRLQALMLTSRTGIPEEDASAVTDEIFLPALTLFELYGCSATLTELVRQLRVPHVSHLILGAAIVDELETWTPLLRDRLNTVTWVQFDGNADEQWSTGDILLVSHDAFPKLRSVELFRCQFSKPDSSYVYSRWTDLEGVTVRGSESYTTDEYMHLCEFLALLELGIDIPDLHLTIADVDPVPEWLPVALARAVGRKNCHIYDETGSELHIPRHDYAEFTDSEDESTDTSAADSDDEGDDDGDGDGHGKNATEDEEMGDSPESEGDDHSTKDTASTSPTDLGGSVVTGEDLVISDSDMDLCENGLPLCPSEDSEDEDFISDTE